MARRKAPVRIVGLEPIVRDLDKAARKDARKAAKDASKAAAEVVVPEAKKLARELDGHLRGSIKAGATQKKGGYVKAGTPARVPYAGVQHFGWPAHGITPDPFIYDAMDSRISEVVAAYQKKFNELSETISAT